MTIRPALATDDALEYLDELRESGVTNMFGAGEYLREMYGFREVDAKAVLLYWMKTFSERHPE
jgi:hypothetical protein